MHKITAEAKQQSNHPNDKFAKKLTLEATDLNFMTNSYELDEWNIWAFLKHFHKINLKKDENIMKIAIFAQNHKNM